jgi:hypothetical protein
MVSVWWMVGAFLMGGLAGLVVFSLIGMAAREARHAVMAEKGVRQVGLTPVTLDHDWMVHRRRSTQ